MPRIRKVEIRHFRGIRELSWRKLPRLADTCEVDVSGIFPKP